MSIDLISANLVTYSLQIGMLVAVAAVIPAVLRLKQPGAKLIYWQILLAACLLLPLQPWKQIVASGTVVVTTDLAPVEPVHRTSAMPAIPPSEIVLLIVLAGVAIRLGWLALGFWKLRRYRRHSRPLEPAPTWSVEASLLLSDEIASPVTFGWRKPVVLLPANFPALASKVQEAILCHEILHVRRRDWCFTVAEELVRAVLWFHPAIWWLLGEIGLAREQEVDRLAIEITDQREEYMDALLAIAGARTQLDLAPAPLFLRKRHLKQRVILILKETRMSKTRLISTLTTGLAVLAAACWLVTGAFPLTAEPQVVSDAAGVTVNLNGATLLHRTPVHYPPAALQHGVEGAVSVQLKLDAAGNVSDAHVLGGPEELRRAALESVLEWHFARDAANATRVVQIDFQLPKAATATEPAEAPKAMINGVPGYVTRGVVGGIVGGVPAGAPPPPPPPPSRLARITVSGLSEEAKTQLLASLPVHEGDAFSNDLMQRATQAVSAFDEHLSTTWSSSADGATLQISAPGVPVAGVRIKVGANVQSAKVVTKVAPVYPQLAKAARVEGVVHLAVVIAKDGTMQEIHSLGGPALLIQAAMDAVKQWVYAPTFLNGEPTAVETTIDVNFTLQP